jgi:hypothetical protein
MVVSFIDKEKERQKPVILHERTQKTKYEPHQKQAQLGELQKSKQFLLQMWHTFTYGNGRSSQKGLKHIMMSELFIFQCSCILVGCM